MTNKEKNFVSSVIYVHNAENNIKDFLTMIISVMQENFEHSEIICVNDSSDDDSLKLIKEVSDLAENTSLSVINMSYFHGLELSMNAGVELAIGDFVFEFDNTNNDFSKDIIMDVYRHSLQGFDIVSASPKRKEKFSSRIFYKIFEKFTDNTMKMRTESFRILSRRVINRISSMSKAIPYRKPMYASCGFKTDIIEYVSTKNITEKRDKKEKKYRKDLATDSLILFTQLGYKMSVLMVKLMMAIILGVIIYTITAYIISSPVSGWTSTILFLSVAFLGLFGILTIIIKYLQILVDLVFRRKRYTYESIEKLTK